MSEIYKSKAARGTVMRTLALFYPNQVTSRQILAALSAHGIGVTSEMSGVTAYLKDKGYIQYFEAEPYTAADGTLKLTALGMDLIEGTVSDKGVLL